MLREQFIPSVMIRLLLTNTGHQIQTREYPPVGLGRVIHHHLTRLEILYMQRELLEIMYTTKNILSSYCQLLDVLKLVYYQAWRGGSPEQHQHILIISWLKLPTSFSEYPWSGEGLCHVVSIHDHIVKLTQYCDIYASIQDDIVT